MNWYTVIIVALVLITLDKGITIMNIKVVEKNYPNVDPYSIERNPVAKFTFQKFGLYGGSAIYWVFALATFFFAILLFYYPAKAWAPGTAVPVAFYVMCIFYSFVIMNNFYFLLKYSKLL